MCPLQVSGLRAKEIEPTCLLSSEQRRLAIRSRRHDRQAAGHLGGLLRKAPLTILGGIPPSPPAVALAVSPSSFPLPSRGWDWVTWNAEPRRRAWQPQETHLPAVSQHLAWTPGANQAALGTARGIPTDALVWSQPGRASC